MAGCVQNLLPFLIFSSCWSQKSRWPNGKPPLGPNHFIRTGDLCFCMLFTLCTPISVQFFPLLTLSPMQTITLRLPLTYYSPGQFLNCMQNDITHLLCSRSLGPKKSSFLLLKINWIKETFGYAEIKLVFLW